MIALLPELQATLYAEIPLSQAMQLEVGLKEPSQVLVTAPLAPNINHKDTAFAGSLNAALTLAGWSCVWLLVRDAELEGKIVIQDSAIKYHRPVTTDFTAQCAFPAAAERDRFLRVFRRRGAARLELTATIQELGRLAVSFVGRYVVQR